MSDFYQLTNSTSDFKSRSNDVFDKLSNLEKQHDVQAKTQTPILVPDEDTPSSSTQNPTIPSHAITFKKRPADDDSFARPSEKWKKYDLDDVNEHQTSGMGNRHALNEFFRTRAKPSTTKEDETPFEPIFKRPLPKKVILTNEEDDDNNQFIPIRAPVPVSTTDKNDEDDEATDYKLKSSRIKPRGVLSTTEKKPIKSSMEISEEKDPGENEEDKDEDDDDDDAELFEP